MSARREGATRRGPLLALAALALLCAAAPALAYVFECTDAGTPIFWPSLRDNPPGALQFTYQADASDKLGGNLAANPALKAALDDAIGRWQTVPSATVRFQPALVSSDTDLDAEGINRVIFTSRNARDFTGADGPFIVGLTTTSFNPTTGVMIDADMQFNDTSTNFALTLTGKTGTSQINIRDVVTHETGHALGLDHSHVKGSTMYFAAADGATNLSPDDVAGISLLYPAASFRGATGQVSGRVTRGGSGVFGLHVVCVDVATGKPTVAAFTAGDGHYKIEGVPPGKYVVVAGSIKPNALGSFFESADVSVQNLLVFAPSPSAPPTVIQVRPTLEVSNVDFRTEDGRVDAAGGADAASALPLVVGGAQARRLVPGSASRPADFYSFSATKGTTVTINVTSHRLWVPSNPTLEVLDTAGNLLAGPSTDLAAADLDDRLVFSPPFSGTRSYVLRVKAAHAGSASFPDPRSINDSESLYLLTTQSVRANHPPRVLNSAALSNLTTMEAGINRGGPISVPLSGVVTDDEDPLSALTWVPTNLPADLFSVDAGALAADPPVLRIIPKQFRSGNATFTLMVFDTDDASASIPVTVNIAPVNDPPVLKIDGGAQLTHGGPRIVTLDAGASRPGPIGDTAEDNQQMAYAWSQLAGPLPVSSTGASSTALKVLARDAGVYRFQLTCTEAGGDGLKSTITQDVTVDNLPPTPRAVAPSVAVPGQLVRVRADLSSDPNEELTTGAFRLGLVSPANMSVPTTREATAAFAFTAPAAAGRYVFELAATDSGFRQLDGTRSNPLTARTTFAVEVRAADDLPPTADAGVERVVAPGDAVTLDGRDSIGAAGESVSYSWTLDPSAPAAVALSNATGAQATFAAPGTPGVYGFNLVVRGGRTGLVSAPATTRVRVLPVAGANRHAPVARARFASATGSAPGDRILLDGTGSGDPDGSLVNYTWSQVAGPQAALSSNTGSTPSFVPPAPGLYRFELVVNDGQLDSRPALVDIPVRPSGAVAQGLVISARQPAAGAAPVSPPAELRFVVDGTTAPANAVELHAHTQSGQPTRAVTWEQLSGPRLPVTASVDGATLIVLPRQARVHTFRVTAILPDGQQLEQVVYLIADRSTSRVPRAAVADGATLDVVTGAEVELDGSASRDLPATGGEETNASMVYYWEQEDGPPVTMTAPFSAHPGFAPPMAGRYAFRLRVDNQRFGTLSAPSAGAVIAEVHDAVVVAAAATGTAAATTPAAAGGSSGGCSMTRHDALASWDLTPLIWLCCVLLGARPGKQRTPGVAGGSRGPSA